jgi:hypothetical protein
MAEEWQSDPPALTDRSNDQDAIPGGGQTSGTDCTDPWLAALERLWSRCHSSTEAAESLIKAAAADLAELCNALGLDEDARRFELQRLATRLRATVERSTT